MTPEQLAKYREIAENRVTREMSVLLDHIDAQAARIKQLEYDRDQARQSANLCYEKGPDPIMPTTLAAEAYFWDEERHQSRNQFSSDGWRVGQAVAT